MYIIYTYNICIYIICVICVISKRSSSIDQISIKIKHKEKWMVKFVKTTPYPFMYIPSSVQLNTWKRLSYMCFIHFLLNV